MGLHPQNRRGKDRALLFSVSRDLTQQVLHFGSPSPQSHRGPGREKQDSKDVGKRGITHGGVVTKERALEQGQPVALARAGLLQLFVSVIPLLILLP